MPRIAFTRGLTTGAPQRPLPVVLVSKPHEQLAGLFTEHFPVPLGEDVLPVARNALSEERGRIFFAPLPASGEFLEAGGFYAPCRGLFVGVDSEEGQQSLDIGPGLVQQIFVAD